MIKLMMAARAQRHCLLERPDFGYSGFSIQALWCSALQAIMLSKLSSGHLGGNDEKTKWNLCALIRVLGCFTWVWRGLRDDDAGPGRRAGTSHTRRTGSG
jgi:hypothetical protein